MTPKEKAEQLVEKFKPLCGGYWGGKINKSFAKKSALIAVDEILAEYNRMENYNFVIEKEYWQQVKTEIENL